MQLWMSHLEIFLNSARIALQLQENIGRVIVPSRSRIYFFVLDPIKLKPGTLVKFGMLISDFV